MKTSYQKRLFILLALSVVILASSASAQTEEFLGTWRHTWTENMPVFGLKSNTVTFDLKEGGQALYTLTFDKATVDASSWKKSGNVITVTTNQEVYGERISWKLVWEGGKLCYAKGATKLALEPNCFQRTGALVPSGSSSASTAPTGGFYRGTIGGKYEIVMILTVRSADRVLKGDYYYTSKNKPIALTGSYDLNNRFTLTEQVDGQVTGTFTGTISPDSLTGEWRSPDGKRVLPFSVKRAKE